MVLLEDVGRRKKWIPKITLGLVLILFMLLLGGITYVLARYLDLGKNTGTGASSEASLKSDKFSKLNDLVKGRINERNKAGNEENLKKDPFNLP